MTFGAERLLIVENSELALYAVREALAAKQPETRVEGASRGHSRPRAHRAAV